MLSALTMNRLFLAGMVFGMAVMLVQPLSAQSTDESAIRKVLADQVQRRGFDRRFQRIWGFYLAYCEAAFDPGNTDVIQVTLRKPGP